MTMTQHGPTTTRVGTPGSSPGHDGSGRTHAVGVPLGVATLLALLVAAFAWPAVSTAPRGVALAVVAPPAVVQQVEAQLASGAGADAFDVRVLADRAEAEQAVRDREVYGALVLGPQGGEALFASAASPAVAQVLTQLADGIPPQAGGPLPVTDVVPLPADDPRGVGLAAGLLPLVIGGLALGAATALRVRGGAVVRGGVLLAGAALGGLVVVGLLQGWLGALEGSFWANAAAAALLVLAVGAVVAGLVRLLGGGGLALGALVMVVLGNPLSGVTSAPEMLPGGWGALGQWLPPGAGATALRSVAFFDGAGAGMALLVLAGWALVGLALVGVPLRGRARGTVA
ncbi:hypothetical protein [Ornithinimicrobium pekingense]|uniref:Membrane protein n=1 Tax=Ornithinimicrobium pekingense TaxID=384677 RepID=A0ABQ2F893_9MICO|nr:hypothetical protein [Ornithinimicrobium pekingense]GGK71614.1 membrane protein [Ornithinimicrobium pekingense]